MLSDESEAADGAQRSTVIGAESCNIPRLGGGQWLASRSGLFASLAQRALQSLSESDAVLCFATG